MPVEAIANLARAAFTGLLALLHMAVSSPDPAHVAKATPAAPVMQSYSGAALSSANTK